MNGYDRAVYPWAIVEDDRGLNWRDGEIYSQVVVDKKTGIAFTAHNTMPFAIPRFELANLLDEGFEP